MRDLLTFPEIDDGLWDQYDELATRSYGHPLADITLLRDHADLRVATRAGQVIAGGLGLLVPQFFGGSPVPSACLGAGCVAPEERGEHLATRMTDERLRPLREQGAVISTVSTASNGYARRLGWQAPTHVFAWSIATDDLKRSFNGTHDFAITHGTTEDGHDLQRNLACQWNGPVLRPDWWSSWKQTKNTLTTYEFFNPRRVVSGVLTLTTTRQQGHGRRLTVHDFWAADENTAVAMLGFLGRYNTRVSSIDFRRGTLPPSQTLLYSLHRYRMAAQAWHPWMLRILDLPAAIRLRGWPSDLDVTVPVEIDNDDNRACDRYLFQLTGGAAEITPTETKGLVRFTRCQLAVWYAGGYRTTTSARMAGVHAVSDDALTTLIHSTTAFEPWLPDHF